MGDSQLTFFDNLIYIRKYRNRFHVWFECRQQDWLLFFNQVYNEEYVEDMEPKKLIIWEE